MNYIIVLIASDALYKSSVVSITTKWWTIVTFKWHSLQRRYAYSNGY